MNDLILYIEDREEDVFLLKYAFESAGIQNPVQVLSDGEQAVNYLAGRGDFADRAKYPLPLLTLLDLQLPIKTGLEVLEWTREQPGLRSLIVLIMSSSVYEQDVVQAYALGANGFLVKPSSIEDFADMCRAIKHYWLVHNRPPVVRA